MVLPSTRWSMAAGGFAFLCGSVLMSLLSPMSTTLMELLSFPADLSAFVLAAPAAFVGAVAWWSIVERRKRYTYLHGAGFGLVTAISVVLFWILVFTGVWGVALVLTGWMLVTFVLVVAVAAGLVVGVSSMYVRRRLDDGRPTRKAPSVGNGG